MGYLCTDGPKTLLLQLLIGLFFLTLLRALCFMFKELICGSLRGLEDNNTRKTKRRPFSRPDTGQVWLLCMRSFAVPRIRIKQR